MNWSLRVGRMAMAVTAFISVSVSCTTGDAPDVTNGDPVLEEGRSIYVRQCSSCHGGAGGGGRGPKLADGAAEAEYPNVDDQVNLVLNGRKLMPAFDGKLDRDQIVAVVRYTREIL